MRHPPNELRPAAIDVLPTFRSEIGGDCDNLELQMANQRRVTHAKLLTEKLVATKEDFDSMSHMLSKVQLEIQTKEIELMNKIK